MLIEIISEKPSIAEIQQIPASLIQDETLTTSLWPVSRIPAKHYKIHLLDVHLSNIVHKAYQTTEILSI
jgi:hypothetical protein